MSKLLLFMLMFSLTILGNNAMNQAKNLTNGKVLAASYASDGSQKLFAITSSGAYLFIKHGSNFNKFFAKTFKNTETPLFRSAGLTDIDKNGSLDLWYATKSNNKKTLYVVNTRPKKGKYSFYIVALRNNGSVVKSGNLQVNGKFHKWMTNKVKHLNQNVNVVNKTSKRPPLQLVKPNAVKIAEGLVDGKVLRAGFYTNQNGSKFLFALTSSKAYLFLNNGNSYKKFFNKKLKNRYQLILNSVGMYDVKGNGFGDFYYMVKNNAGNKVLSVVNTKPKQGKYSFYLLMKKTNGSLTKSGNLKINGKFHKWMKKKLGINDTVIVQAPKEDKPMLGGSYIYLCDITTNGKGGYRTGGNYCGISINDFKGYEIIFQQVYGPVNYIAAHERYRNGTWKLTYKGAMKTLRLSDVRKTNKSTHINFSVNGAHERYDSSVTKVRVYKKAIIVKMPNNQEARNIFNNNVRLRRNETIVNVFVYKENNQIKIAVITTRKLYILVNQNYSWRVNLKSNIKLKRVKMAMNFNGMEDVQKDNLKDIYYTTVDKRKAYNLLNLYSVGNKKTYTAYARMGEAIGDFDPEVEFKFTKNTPNNLKPWFKRMIFKFGFVKKPREISQNDPKDAVQLWVRDNGFLNKNRELQLRLRMYNGDQDSKFVAKGIHPIIATITANNVVYRAHYKGIVTAYDRNTNKSYILYVSKIKRNFVTALNYSNNKIFLGTQNDGLIIFDKNANTLKVFKNRKLKNKDIWKIIKKGNSYLIFTDSNRAVKIKARKLEK